MSQLRTLLFVVIWLLPDVGTSSELDTQSFPSLTASANIPAAEMNALYDLYTSTNGAHWQWSKNPSAGIPWNFTNTSVNNPCDDHWQGIKCNNYHVTGINLPSFNLVGTIPSSLNALSLLYYLGFASNYLSGTIPETLGDLLALQYLYLYQNDIHGTIPSKLGDLTVLLDLFLNNNYLSGAIPEHLGNLGKLARLRLESNALTGNIPDSLSKLHSLQYFSLYNCSINGTLPNSLGDLTGLQRFDVHSNLLTGTIPETLGNLLLLELFYLNSNYLIGTIPEALGNLTKLLDLNLNSNGLTGTIPNSLGKLSRLESFNLQSNYLSGPIPGALSKMDSLDTLYLYNNSLTGTIPDTLAALSSLSDLSLYRNKLSGSIPASLGNLSSLLGLDLHANNLTHSIPETLSKLNQLKFLSLYANKLTGTMAFSFRQLTNLGTIVLGENKLSGSIPYFISTFANLQFLDLDTNLLTGSIPILSNTNLHKLQLDHNLLTGSVPSFQLLRALQVLMLQNNFLTGALHSVFNSDIQLKVATIVLSDNLLTGTLPDNLFRLPIKSFVGTSNCFRGPLPIDAICGNVNMVSFVVDGMSSAESCRNKLFFGSLNAYTLEHQIGGSLPTCLFQLPNIATLHLSGNGLTGRIPNDIVLSDTLMDVSLSHNALTGSIPEQMQLKKWSNIDLSFNRLSGTLSSSFASNVSVELENNRLSGSIPASFNTMASVSILGSNTFSCSYDQSDLPQNDPNQQHYHCGSNSFNVLFYIWLCAAVCTLTVLAYFEWKYSVLRSILSRDITLRDTNLYTTLVVVCQLSLKCMLYSITVLLPLYALCSTSYGTQTYKYAYQVSAVYMSGAVPFALDWLFWWILLLGIGCVMLYVPSTRIIVQPVKIRPSYHSIKQTMGILIPYFFVDCIVVVGINVAYVYVAVYESSSLLLPIQTLLSIFKVLWGGWALPSLMTVLTQRKRSKIQDITQIVVNLLNNIAIPCLVGAVVSPNCFYNALVAAPAVTSTFTYRDCRVINSDVEQCLLYVDISVPTSFNPPFTYNYQCSSSLITYYSPAFVSMCIVSTFVSPSTQYLCQWLHRRATPGTYWYKLLNNSLSEINKPLRDTANIYDRSYLTNNKLVATLVSTLGLILTFGVMFPPLCVALTVSMCATVLIFRVNVSNFIYHSNQQVDEKLMELIKAECNSIDSMRVLKGSIWILITVSCWFYTLFLFDTLGDAVGFEGAYWVLIVMPLMPFVVYVVYRILCKYFEHKRNLVNDPALCQLDVGAGVELRTINESSSAVHNVLVVGIDPEKGEAPEVKSDI